ncbi:TDP-N-acetylfucosamine:lipid II N-acetylfucosaminyltransferase [Aquimarina latercula]|uniref:TDP-N-acetylfucosamine:lipid II N-acetylfucosaminyltransferase n=1 Tax=Aquimarina latercula TaxID=987 RepID=UPI000403858A|nr:TDP-N-acetylfucosamine:lipid II N-acetylfucosaminyltransferase [Aquimarina latercula]
MNNLHIINDEKFVDDLIDNYEKAYPNKNRYIIVLFNANQEVRFVKQKNKVELVYYKLLISHIKNTGDQKQAFFIHGLDRIKLKLLQSFRNYEKIIVHFWGADIYLLPKFKGKLLLPHTQKVFDRITSFFYRLKENYRGYYYHYKYKKLLKKVAFYSTVIPTEKKYIEGYLPNARYVHFNYVDIETLRLKNFKVNNEATDILIGNSSSFTSNHIEVFNEIEKIKTFDPVKKIVPINYGNNTYAKELTDYLENNNLRNYVPLTEFLPPEEYVKILSNCSIAIMNHQRQQAVGNIIICLWLGMRVFLSENNPVFNYFKNKGIAVFSIESEFEEGFEFKGLKQEEIKTNIDFLSSIYSKTMTIEHINKIVKLVHE